MEILDDFLDQKEFNEIQTLMMSPEFPWFFAGAIDTETEADEGIDKFQLTHMFHFDFSPQSLFCEKMRTILVALNPLSIWRIKANLLTRTHDIVENTFHIDIEDLSEEKLKQWTTAIFYVNTNNGYTKFEDGTKVESVANRMVIFPANLKHTGTSCTDDKARIVINFDYFKH